MIKVSQLAKKTSADPTGQRVNRAKSRKRIDRRLEIARREVIALFNRVPRTRSSVTKIVNAYTVVYDYDITPEQMEVLDQQVTTIINTELETSADRVPFDWWYKQDVELPYRQGTLEELVQYNQLIAGAIAGGVTVRGLTPQRLPAETFITSPPYNQALNAEYVRNYTVIKSLSDRTSSQVMERIQAGVQAGDTPTVITKSITERFDVAKSNAKRIVDTEVNWAYNDAKLNTVIIAEKETGLRSAVRHISALTPTTRETHAARNGFAYSVADQRQWWMSGANLINCKCTTKTVLVDSKGNVI